MRFLLRALWALLTGRTVPVRMFNGHRGLLDLAAGRVLPALGGADDDEGDDASDEGDDADDEGDETETEGDDAADDTDDDANAEDQLPDNVKAILKKERDARRAAEKREKAAKRKLRLAAKPDADDKPKPKADDAPDPTASVTVKLRRANLKSALADEGITGPRAKAAMRLLDGVDYDDDDEPTNLADVLEEAEEIYGTQLIRGTSDEDDDSADGKSAKRKAPKINGGSGNQGGGKGPRLTAEELAAAKKAGMTPEKWEAMKGVSSLADYQAVQKKLAAK